MTVLFLLSIPMAYLTRSKLGHRAILLISAIDNSHAVADKIRYVGDTRSLHAVVYSRIRQLVICPTTDYLGFNMLHGILCEDSTVSTRAEDVARLGQDAPFNGSVRVVHTEDCSHFVADVTSWHLDKVHALDEIVVGMVKVG